MSPRTHALEVISAMVVGMAVGAAAVLIAAPGKPATTRIGQADILIERTSYDGHVEYSGYLTRLVYGADGVLIEFVDDTDGIFRNGLEARP